MVDKVQKVFITGQPQSSSSGSSVNVLNEPLPLCKNGQTKPVELISIQDENGVIFKYAADDTNCEHPIEKIIKYDNKVIRTVFNNGKKDYLEVREVGANAGALFKYDDDGNIIATYARNGETFAKTAQRIGLTPDELAKTNPKAYKNGWFIVGNEVKVKEEYAYKLDLQAYIVDPKTEKRIFHDNTFSEGESYLWVSKKQIKISKGMSWYSLAKQDLIDCGNNNPSVEEISERMVEIRKINKNLDSNFKFTVGTEISIPDRSLEKFVNKYGFNLEKLQHEFPPEPTSNLQVQKTAEGGLITGKTSSGSFEILFDKQSKMIHRKTYYESGKPASYYDDNTLIEYNKNGTLQNVKIDKVTEGNKTFANKYFHIPNSQINNAYYKGDPYDVSGENGIINITNKKTRKKTKLDIHTLMPEATAQEKLELLILLKTLPGEVLEELSIEPHEISNETFAVLENALDGTAGTYTPSSNKIVSEVKTDTFVHELGHAVDHTKNGNLINKIRLGNYSQSMKNQKIVDTYEKEMKKYLAAGNKKFDKEDPSTKNNNYNTYNIKEMFAESYTLMMLGDCASKDCILKYFPETLALVKKELTEIRKLPYSERHSK